ncbi:hypothetical protein V494_06494 [Pseudogymnoascus sp. VKM F-4513 (FW-928)]|nr:hypothetical protein V494_06494 [Pseudogymnoascus sp. VKM F-4513 (FW-928)]
MNPLLTESGLLNKRYSVVRIPGLKSQQFYNSKGSAYIIPIQVEDRYYPTVNGRLLVPSEITYITTAVIVSLKLDLLFVLNVVVGGKGSKVLRVVVVEGRVSKVIRIVVAKGKGSKVLRVVVVEGKGGKVLRIVVVKGKGGKVIRIVIDRLAIFDTPKLIRALIRVIAKCNSRLVIAAVNFATHRQEA